MSLIDIRPLRPGEHEDCERVLRSLPDWFGIESALVAYVRDVQELPTWVAELDGRVIGFLTTKRHFPAAAELLVMGVEPELHGRGIGRRLVERAERALREQGVRLLQVKTVGPSRPDAAYERTRGFYEHLGFRPLEETALWGEANPCLILVKPLGA